MAQMNDTRRILFAIAILFSMLLGITFLVTRVVNLNSQPAGDPAIVPTQPPPPLAQARLVAPDGLRATSLPKRRSG